MRSMQGGILPLKGNVSWICVQNLKSISSKMAEIKDFYIYVEVYVKI